MLLEKGDLKQIEKIVEKTVEKSEARINKKIDSVEVGLKEEIRETVKQSENRVVAIISREVSDLAEINRAVIDKVDRVEILEKRLRRVEHKVGIVG